MNPILKALMMAGAVITVGGTDYVLYVPNDGVKMTDLVDAGIGDCPQRVLTCHIRIGQGMRNRLADAGYSLRPKQKHITLSSRIAVCGSAPDFEAASMAFKKLINDELDDEALEIHPEVECRVRTFAQYGRTPGIRELIVETPPCKRRPGAGVCNKVDGGTAINWNVYPGNQLTGAGCQSVECSVTYGEDPREVL